MSSGGTEQGSVFDTSSSSSIFSTRSPSLLMSSRRSTISVRSNASSAMSLPWTKNDPPVIILPHYHSPFEAHFYNRPDATHFMGTDVQLGTICVSVTSSNSSFLVLIRTSMKFMSIQVPESVLSTPEFIELVDMYPKRLLVHGLIHYAFREYFSSIPDLENILKQGIARPRDHSVFVLSDLGWTGSHGHIMSLVDCLSEIKNETFPTILRNLEAQMDAEHRLEALEELIETERRYCSRMQTLVNVYLYDAREYEGPNPPLDKYEIRVIFNNIEQIIAVSTAFVRDLDMYRSEAQPQRDLGEICQQHMKHTACYRRYLLGYSKSTQMISRLLKKNANFQKFLDQRREAANNMALADLLVEPTQRIAKYPLLFKEILAGTSALSQERKGLIKAIELASEISEMENGKPEQNAALQFRIRNTVDGCPDTLIRADRAVHAFLDGYETNMLTGERGKPLTMVLFSDKVMLLRRPKNARGEQLFAASGLSSGRITEKRNSILSSKWKFMGWMDITKLDIVCAEQTDPEGLFCITTRDNVDSKDEPWEGIRGFLPEDFDKRDPFISKFNAALSLAKAHKGDPGHTCRLHVAELELFFNAYPESVYRDLKHKGQMTLFYQDELGAKPELIHAAKLPPFVGVIQALESSYSIVLRGMISMSGYTGSLANPKESSSFTSLDSFQIYLTELASNLQWTIFHFDPYQRARLHFSRFYLTSGYITTATTELMKTHYTFKSKTTRLGRPKSGYGPTLGYSSVPASPSGIIHNKLVSGSSNASIADIPPVPLALGNSNTASSIQKLTNDLNSMTMQSIGGGGSRELRSRSNSLRSTSSMRTLPEKLRPETSIGHHSASQPENEFGPPLCQYAQQNECHSYSQSSVVGSHGWMSKGSVDMAGYGVISSREQPSFSSGMLVMNKLLHGRKKESILSSGHAAVGRAD
ncbi:hypothetical protein BGW41_001625 [Actinomortierella wolfii]|nr:hypothetical protein BGW41_001625 [Actinomortierella wolfii]